MFEPTNTIIAHLGDKHELLSLVSPFGLNRKSEKISVFAL